MGGGQMGHVPPVKFAKKRKREERGREEREEGKKKRKKGKKRENLSTLLVVGSRGD